ncbi:MAG TPA: hypothetical protein VGA80_15270 [Flavobacteriaceae bacterium]
MAQTPSNGMPPPPSAPNDGPPPPVGVPIDGALPILVIVGLIYGIKNKIKQLHS